MCPEHAHFCKCSNWDYEKFDGIGKRSKVYARSVALLADLKNSKIDRKKALANTRTTHVRLFSGLAKAGCEYFVGNFRGSQKCLKEYEVVINTANGVVSTTAPSHVAAEMAALSNEIEGDLTALADAGGPEALETKDDLVNWLDVALERMVRFLSIHPYANGNGHISRFMMFCYLSAVGVWPESWPLDDHPPYPYDEAIAAFRNNYPDGLRDFLLKYIVWEPKVSNS
ncbi:Fic family protein [Paraburkholderia sp. DHOC27]|uniref:Fic family protein n=1 Tax=Paraburkholderia sp. DHOC27 TaxID=2303330 RepID=UPI000E3ED9C0|nr:Fic family protein [Paraburkholderia sp. DHOC27]RFU48657.1 hypothetical protein D0B32_02125 [Paraburkholderia sp. DHOC27]